MSKPTFEETQNINKGWELREREATALESIAESLGVLAAAADPGPMFVVGPNGSITAVSDEDSRAYYENGGKLPDAAPADDLCACGKPKSVCGSYDWHCSNCDRGYDECDVPARSGANNKPACVCGRVLVRGG